MASNLQKELSQAQARLNSLIQKGASDYEIQQARNTVARLSRAVTKRGGYGYRTKREVDRYGDFE